MSMAALNPATMTLRASMSAPMLQSINADAPTHKVMGTIAMSYGAKIKDTLHHRGEHEVGAVKGPDDEDLYVPRALWTETYDSPMKHSHRAFEGKTFVGDELKRVANESRKKDYYRKIVDHQLTKGSTMKNIALTEKKEHKELVESDAKRHNEDLAREVEVKAEVRKRFKSELDKQVAESVQRAKENLKQDAYDAAEVKVATMKHLSQEMEKHARARKNAQREMLAGMQASEIKRLDQRAAKEREDEGVRRQLREQLESDEFRLEATQVRLKGAQKQQNFNYKVYERTAGKENNDRARAEHDRVHRDERMHTLRTDTYYAAREHARERQRQAMVAEVDRQQKANEAQKGIHKLVKEAEKEALIASTKMAMDQELEKSRKKRAEELQLQNDLLKMIEAKESFEKKEGVRRPPAASTMSFSKSGGVPADLAGRVDASRYVSKPLGKMERAPGGDQRAVPIDASPSSMRRQLAKSRSAPDPTHASNPLAISGVVGVFSGNGGPTAAALNATGGIPERFLTKATGLAVRDRSLSSSWNDGLRPQDMRAARKVAAQREAEKALANHD